MRKGEHVDHMLSIINTLSAVGFQNYKSVHTFVFAVCYQFGHLSKPTEDGCIYKQLGWIIGMRSSVFAAPILSS